MHACVSPPTRVVHYVCTDRPVSGSATLSEKNRRCRGRGPVAHGAPMFMLETTYMATDEQRIYRTRESYRFNAGLLHVRGTTTLRKLALIYIRLYTTYGARFHIPLPVT